MAEDPHAKWTEQDAQALRTMLDKIPRFLPHLATRVPKITANQTIEARAMSGSEVKGADVLLEAIKDMATRGKAAEPTEKPKFIGGEGEQ
jgi:hypothetical protein